MSQVTDVAHPQREPMGNKFDQLKQFYRDVKAEMKKVSWPTTQEVYSTTMVVLIAVFFFGFFLWGSDVLISLAFEQIAKMLK
jgi:preprotein translocase subunit SecE